MLRLLCVCLCFVKTVTKWVVVYISTMYFSPSNSLSLSVLACCGDYDWMRGLSSRLTGQHPIINLNVLHVLCMSIVAPIAFLTIPGKRDSPPHTFLPKISSLLIKGVFSCPCGGLGQGVFINIWPVKPFETVIVIKGYTNKIELNWIELNDSPLTG